MGLPDVTSSEQTSSAVPEHGHESPRSKNPFSVIGRFIRQVIAELGKVVVPTRKDLISYSITVLLFVTMMILFVFGLDTLFGWLSRIAFVQPDGL